MIVAILIGILLRIYGVNANYCFSGELGKELLYLRHYALMHTLPISGMSTSHEWLNYGPFYYWIMIPIFNLFKGNPFILFWSALAVSVIGLVLGYTLLKKIAGEKIALISTVITAISPLLIWQTRNSKLHVFFFILSPIFMYALYKMWQGKTKWVFWAGIIFGLMFSFHFSQIPLLLVVAFLFYLKKNVYKFPDWIKFALGVVIPNITLIWQDKNLAIWLPYRVVNFAVKDPAGTWKSLVEYFGRNFFWDQRLWILGAVIFASVFVSYIRANRKKFTKDFLRFYLISSISVTLVANILHGTPPVHYFLPVFITLPVLFAACLEKFKFWYIPVAAIFLVNLGGYFAFDKPNDYVPFYKQEAIADFVIADAKGKSFLIKRTGPYDYFPEEYSQNYKYLILWKGGNLMENSGNVYTINETLGTVAK